MLGTLAIGYLFLGGTGAGALTIASILDLALVRETFGAHACISVEERTPAQRVVAFSMLFGFAFLALGVLCLMFDLGRMDRMLSLFLHPSFSFLTLGSFVLAAMMALGAILLAVRFLYIPVVGTRLVRGLEACAPVVGLAVMAYTGMLLQSLSAVAFWSSWLLPLLFVASSLSCGIAVLLLVAFFTGSDAHTLRIMSGVAQADALFIVAETLIAAFFVAGALANGGAAEVSAQRLLTGDLALWWWLAFVSCGIAAPFALESLGTFRVRTAATPALVAVAAALVLIGGFGMRYSVVAAGVLPDMVLEDVSADANADASAFTIQASGEDDSPETNENSDAAAPERDEERTVHGFIRN